jgi:hypothetical protein
MGTLYDQDIAAWARLQAALLRDRQWDKLDVEHLAEEIADLGLRDSWELGQRFALLLSYLLKWQNYPERRGRSWASTLRNQRMHIACMLEDAPILTTMLADDEWLSVVWKDARDAGVHQGELDYDAMPLHWPWPVAQVLSQDFFPE